MRPKRYGEKRAALRSALRTAVAGKRSEPSRRNPGQAAGAADEGPAKSVRQKIEEERKGEGPLGCRGGRAGGRRVF